MANTALHLLALADELSRAGEADGAQLGVQDAELIATVLRDWVLGGAEEETSILGDEAA